MVEGQSLQWVFGRCYQRLKRMTCDPRRRCWCVSQELQSRWVVNIKLSLPVVHAGRFDVMRPWP